MVKMLPGEARGSRLKDSSPGLVYPFPALKPFIVQPTPVRGISPVEVDTHVRSHVLKYLRAYELDFSCPLGLIIPSDGAREEITPE
jgi:hypothetical protein